MVIPDRYFAPDSLFLSNFIDDFMKESMKNELIPSVALEVLAKMRKDEVAAATARKISTGSPLVLLANQPSQPIVVVMPDKVVDTEDARKAVARFDSRPYQTVDPLVLDLLFNSNYSFNFSLAIDQIDKRTALPS